MAVGGAAAAGSVVAGQQGMSIFEMMMSYTRVAASDGTC